MNIISENGERVPMQSQWTGREGALRDLLARAFMEAGLIADTEAATVLDQRCDIAVTEPDNQEECFAIVEVKVADPIRGIGQLFAYAHGQYPRPHLVLIVDEAACNSNLAEMWACVEAGIEMWTVRGERVEHRGRLSDVYERVFGE